MIFTPLSGDAASPGTQPLAYVLQIDDVRILLDCGAPDWCPESGEPNWEPYCAALQAIAPSIDLVLFSHGDLPHIGLYAYAHARWGLHAPAYASLPVQSLGRIAVTEEVENIRAAHQVDVLTPESNTDSTSDPSGSTTPPINEAPHPDGVPPNRMRIPTVKEVNTAFNSLSTLGYSQPAHLSGKCQGLTITPFAAGHTLGGTLWKIRSPSSGTIIYAVNMNHMKERHLDGTVLIKSGGGGSAVFEPLARPDLFITDAERTLVTTPRRKDRDAALLEIITTTLEDHRSVLIPCDASTRLLELLILLDQHWSFANLRVPICLVSRTGKEMVNLVRSLVEWMGGMIGKEDVGAPNQTGGRNKRKRDDEDDDMGNLALRFRHLEFFASPSALLATYPSHKPKLILSVPATLSHGPSRALFAEFAATMGNMIVMTRSGETGTLSRVLYDRWENAQKDGYGTTGGVGQAITETGAELKITMRSKIPLQGAELEEHLARERSVKERKAAEAAALVRSQQMLEADQGDDSEDESDDEEGGSRDRDAVGLAGAADEGGDTMDWSLLDTTDGDENAQRAQQLSFDIYLRGNVSRVQSFFKAGAPVVEDGSGSAGGEAGVNGKGEGGVGLTRFRMFPVVERRRRMDMYGEMIDVGAWMRKGKTLGAAEDEKGWTGHNGEGEDGVDIEEAQQEEVPFKYGSEEITLSLLCRLLYVDMEGLNDGRAIKTIVPQVNPRKMIVVHASLEATDALIASCASIRAMTKEIYAPKQGESITIGQQTNTFTIALSDQLLESLMMSKFEDSEVGFVRGRIAHNADSSIPLLEPAALTDVPTTASMALAPAALPTPTMLIESHTSKVLAPRPSTTLPTSTIIGDLKLALLKTRLTALGIGAEFAGEGVLVCSGGEEGEAAVAVKKTGKGQVVLEGSVSSVYYIVRREVYGLHAVIVT